MLVGAAFCARLVLGCGAGAAEAPEHKGTVKVAAVQFISQFAKPELNRKRLMARVREAARNGAKIVVLPETAIPGYMTFDIQTTWQTGGKAVTAGLRGVAPKDVAETVPGPSTRAFAALARELGIYLTVPLIEVDPKGGRYFNTLCLVGPQGKLLAHYRKRNPWPYAERGWATKGDRGLPTVDTPYGRLGLLVCYDINFEPPRLKRKGIDILLYAIAWVDDADSTWFGVQLPGIARRSNFSIIGANWSVPAKPDWHGYGFTRIIDRTGRVLAKARSNLAEETVYAELPIPSRTGR